MKTRGLLLLLALALAAPVISAKASGFHLTMAAYLISAAAVAAYSAALAFLLDSAAKVARERIRLSKLRRWLAEAEAAHGPVPPDLLAEAEAEWPDSPARKTRRLR